jgi:hypothetical protein
VVPRDAFAPGMPLVEVVLSGLLLPRTTLALLAGSRQASPHGVGPASRQLPG